MTGAVFLQVVLRYAFRTGVEGLDEVPRYLFVWLVMIGAAAAMERGEHTALVYFRDHWARPGAPSWRRDDGPRHAALLSMIRSSLILVPNATSRRAPAWRCLSATCTRRCRRRGAHPPADGPGAPGPPARAVAETLLIVFVLCTALGMPIALALGVGTLAAATVFPRSTDHHPGRLVGLLSDSFILLSAPLFILAGNIAARGGWRGRSSTSTVLVGRFRGGLAYVNIVDSLFFGGISGSAVADVSALGTFLIPQMVRKGYDKDFATVLDLHAILAPIIPPSIVAVIYAWMADESVAAIFAGRLRAGAAGGARDGGADVHHRAAARYRGSRRRPSGASWTPWGRRSRAS